MPWPRQPRPPHHAGVTASARVRVAAALVAAAASATTGLACGDPLSGGDDDGMTRVGRWEGQGGDVVRGHQATLLTAAPKKTRTIAAMMFDISGGAPNQTNIQNLILGSGTSLRHMYNEVSYGLQDLTADFYGPYKLPVPNCLTIACCGPSADRTGNGPTVQGLIDALPKKYDHYFWVYGAIPNGADCGTWGDEGSANKPAVYSSYSFHEITGYAQELGHNFGMTHEATMTCPGAKTILNDTGQCTHVEYGSLISFMGQGSSAAYHPSAYHKFQQGWISKCNAVKVGSAGGMYRLVPQELPCDGVQILQIPAPMSRAAPAGGKGTLNTYYLEMRATYGFDKIKPQVIVSIGGALPNMTAPAPYLYMLDMTPESGMRNHTTAGLMTVGQTFVDPAGGLTITLAAIDNSSATVMVQGTGTGSDTCADSTPFTGPGPDGTSCGPVTGIVGDGGVVPPADGGTGISTGGRPGGTGGLSGMGMAGRGGGGTSGSGAGGSASGTGGAPGRTGGAPGTASGGASATGGARGVATGGGPALGTGGMVTAGSGGMASGGTAVGGAGNVGINDPVGGGCACATGGQGGGTPSGWLWLGLGALGTRRWSSRRRPPARVDRA
jgi:MYXO-CTERM domain-containing protein